jgi:hypothetical protein
MGENREELKKRLLAAGSWLDYLALREQLRRDGLTPRQARKEALRQIETRPPKPPEPPPPDPPSPGPSVPVEVRQPLCLRCLRIGIPCCDDCRENEWQAYAEAEQRAGRTPLCRQCWRFGRSLNCPHCHELQASAKGPTPDPPGADSSVGNADPTPVPGEEPDFARYVPRPGHRMTAEECARLARFEDSIWQSVPLCERCSRKFAAPRCSTCLRAHQTVEILWEADFGAVAEWLADWIGRHANDRLTVEQRVTEAELELERLLPSPMLVVMRLVAMGKV